MRINQRLLEYRIRYPFLFIDYLSWLIFDFSKFKLIRKEKIKKVLIIHTGAIGELITITPIIKELRKQLNCSVDCLIKENMYDLLKSNPNINNILFYSDDFNELLSKIKDKDYDLAVIFQASFKNALLCFKAGIRYRIGGFSRIKRFPKFFYTRRTFPVVLMHSLEYSFKIVEKVGIKKPHFLKTEVFIGIKNEEKIKELLRNLKVTSYALIHPGFGPARKKRPPRFWQNENYSKIADYLFEKYNLKIIFTGLEDQKSIIEKIISNCNYKRNMINLAGETNLQEFCALVKNAKFVLAPDTGASHIAASFGVYLVNLMDAPIEEWKPIGIKDKIINIHHPREIKLFEKGKLFKKTGGIISISIEEIKKAINILLAKKTFNTLA